jgi:flagellar motor switch protein FliN
MGDGSLSQDEIDALLQGADDITAGPEPAGMDSSGSRGGSSFSSGEQSNLKNLVNSAITLVAPSLSGYLGGKNLVLSNPVVESKPQDAVRNDFRGKYVQVSMSYSGALNGVNLIIFNFRDAGVISSLMMGDETGSVPLEITDAHQSTIQEFTNQFISSMATQFSNKIGGGVNTTPATVSIAQSQNDLQLPPGDLIKITYDIIIDGVMNSKLYHIMDANLASSLGMGGGGSQSQQQSQYQHTGPQTQISSVRFPQMGESITSGGYGDIALLLDVEMTMTVELGRTTKLVKDILGLGEGSIIELDKLAGEPVDLLVNGKLIARGEVVVIDENFGVRVTDIVSQDERFKSVNK